MNAFEIREGAVPWRRRKLGSCGLDKGTEISRLSEFLRLLEGIALKGQAGHRAVQSRSQPGGCGSSVQEQRALMSGVSGRGTPGTLITFLLQNIEPSVKATVPLPWRAR